MDKETKLCTNVENMMTGESKTFADDFNDRVTKKFKPKFINHVEPVRLIDYLSCLDRVDEEIVEAQHRQYGNITAAGILFDRLIRRPNWLKDLLEALRNPDIKLDFLADDLVKLKLTVTARWNIGEFTDSHGVACVFGHCSPNDETSPKELDTQDVRAVKFESTEDNFAAATGAGIQQLTVAERRENLRLNFMEKVVSYIEGPQDVRNALDEMKEFSLLLYSVEKGSILFNIYVDSLEALENLEQLWRYGGLKKMLDKELLNSDMVKILEETANGANHPVQNIKSHLEVNDTDLLRCRSWLASTDIEIRPHDFANSSMKRKLGRESKTHVRCMKYVLDRLPEELQLITEDPFISQRIHSFYESKELREKIENEKRGTQSELSVLDLFVRWFEEEMSAYLKSLEKLNGSILSDMVLVSAYLIQQALNGKSVLIPLEFSEELRMKSVQIRKREGKLSSDNFFDLIKLPHRIELNKDSMQKTCASMKDALILCESRGSLNFQSKVLRDLFITKIIFMHEKISDFKKLVSAFEHIQTIIGMFQSYWRAQVGVEHWYIAESFSYKDPVLRVITRSGEESMEKKVGEILVTEESKAFVNGDLLSDKLLMINLSADVSPLVDRFDAVKKDDKRKIITVDMTSIDQKYFTPFLILVSTSAPFLDPRTFTEALIYSHRLKVCFTSKGYGLSLLANGLVLDACDLINMGLFLNVTPAAFKLSIKNCQLKSDNLRPALQTGHFRNISHVQMSDNKSLKSIEEPPGLMYMPQLESLEIQNCELGDNGIAMLAKDLSQLVKIRELNVANNQMTSSGLLELSKGMARCKGLTSLRLQKNNLGKDCYFVLASWLRELILLEVLNISECCIADKGASVIAGSILSGSLKKLSMRSNGFTSRGSQEVFEHLQRPPALEHIDFSDNCIFLPTENIGRLVSKDKMAGSEPFTAFLQNKAPLSHLSLWKCGIGEHRIFQDFSKYESFKELTYVCFQENKIHDDFAIDFAACIRNHSRYLQHLNLRHNNIGTPGALKLADALETQDYLEEVLLDRNVIGDPGAIRIVEVCTSKSTIKSVDLSCNYISRETMSKIAGDIGREEKWVHVVPGQKTFQRAGKMSEGSDENKFVVQKLGDNFTVIT